MTMTCSRIASLGAALVPIALALGCTGPTTPADSATDAQLSDVANGSDASMADRALDDVTAPTDGGNDVVADVHASDAGPATRPGPTNTGVPAGTTLTHRNGDIRLETAGETLDGVDLDGCIQVAAMNVTIRRTRIHCSGYYPVEVMTGGSLTIEDSEIDASDSGGIATSGIAFTNYTARRVNIHGSSDGFKADENVLIEDSWVHDLYLGPDDHADGVQGTGGTNVVVRRSFIDIVDHGAGHGGDPNSCFQVGTEWAPNRGWNIEANWLYGGGWSINFGGAGGENNRIVDNRFGRGTGFPGYGPISIDGTSVTASGNVWDDDGSAIVP